MRSTESILAEYKRTDLEKRLNLFLECPSLRSRFMEIDQSEVRPSRFKRSGEENTLVKASWARNKA